MGRTSNRRLVMSIHVCKSWILSRFSSKFPDLAQGKSILIQLIDDYRGCSEINLDSRTNQILYVSGARL